LKHEGTHTDPWGIPAETGSKLDQEFLLIPIGVFAKTFHCPSTIRTIQFDPKLSRKKKNLAASSFAIFLKLSTRFGMITVFI
jgi:hypothetical protein